MTNVVTYLQQSNANGVNVPRWLAYIVLLDGSLWGVRFDGETEEIAKANAISVYESEKNKHKQPVNNEAVTERTDNRGAHLIGTVCMINHGLKQRMRCKAAEVPKYEEKGWVKGGPRTPFQG